MRAMDGLDWAAGAMHAARSRLDIAAQNLANGSTNAFRKNRAVGTLSERGIEMTAVRDDAQGPLRRTGRALDLAIAGGGSFRVRDRNGVVSETRNGAFERDRFGRLCDGEGRIVLGEHGPLTVPADAEFSSSGVVSSRGKAIDRIRLQAGSTLRSGFLEASNVDAIGEMVDVLSAQRSFETAQKVFTAIDSARERATTQVGVLK